MVLYKVALMGAPSNAQIDALEQHISQAIEPFGLKLGDEFSLSISPTIFNPEGTTSAAVIFFGGTGVSEAGLDAVLQTHIPILPIASECHCVSLDIPQRLQPLNCLFYDTHGPGRIATAVLECLGLLPRQRRIFLSYRHDEARRAALQFFDALSARLFDVFLDTHSIAPSEDFQDVLWHRLCDSNVLVMLDTSGYFERRWTSSEFGRALAKKISVLRIGWPGVNPSKRTATATNTILTADEIDSTTGLLSEAAMKQICNEAPRPKGRGIGLPKKKLVAYFRIIFCSHYPYRFSLGSLRTF
jgi:hypothetical protein